MLNMQILHTLHIPVSALLLLSLLLLLSIVSCSSSSDSAAGDSLLYVADPDFLNDAADNDGTRDIVSQTYSAVTSGDDNDSDLPINSSNYEQIAKSVVQAINLVELDTELVNARSLLFELNASGWRVLAGEDGLTGLTLASQEDLPSELGQGDYSLNFTCDKGGMVIVRLTDFNDGPFYHNRASFDNCQWNGQTLDGDIEASGARRAPDLTEFSEYTRTTSGRTIELSGEHEHVFSFFGTPESLTWQDTSVVITNDIGTTEIDNLNWRQEGLDGSNPESIQGFVQLPDGTVGYVVQFDLFASLQTDFNFTPAQTDIDTLSVGVNLEYKSRYFDWESHFLTGFDVPTFPVTDLGEILQVHSDFDIFASSSRFFESRSKDPTPQWQDGEIRISASDSSSLVMSPEPGSDDTALIELNESGEQMPRFWSEGFQVTCPTTVGICG